MLSRVLLSATSPHAVSTRSSRIGRICAVVSALNMSRTSPYLPRQTHTKAKRGQS